MSEKKEAAMVQNAGEYVLQWSGHAPHVTERFSDLLARQALVDVSLICQGQKLRVHKLVLASCSLYFEEMLEQDLGQEPVILLRDLDFEVLKAMVEFMYCGETTISQCYLQTLLDAAHVFKVKELKCIVESMMKSELEADSSLYAEEGRSSTEQTNSADETKNNDRRSLNGKESDKKSVAAESFTESESSNLANVENWDNELVINHDDMDEQDELCTESESDGKVASSEDAEESMDEEAAEDLFDEPSDSEISKTLSSDEETEDIEDTMDNRKTTNWSDKKGQKTSSDGADCCEFFDNAGFSEILRQKEASDERTDCQDHPGTVGECSRVYSHKKRKFDSRDDHENGKNEYSISAMENMEKKSHNSSNDTAKSKDMGKSLKVYTHKRRKFSGDKKSEKNMEKKSHNSSNDTAKSKDMGKSLKVYTRKRRKFSGDKKSWDLVYRGDSMEDTNSLSSSSSSSSANSIDLKNDKLLNDTPTISLDMENSDFMWNLSAESIQYVVGCTINPLDSTSSKNESRDVSEKTMNENFANTNKRKIVRGQIKDLCSMENGEIVETPILRRSIRINQLESDDSLNNNSINSQDKDDNAVRLAKNVGKSVNNGRTDFSDETRSLTRANRRNRDTGFSDENAIISNGNARSLRSSSKFALRKSKRSANSRLEMKDSRENGEKMDPSDFWPRFNTIASVDRALWGDMSDVVENREKSSVTECLTDYSSSSEIPFAVGLLPLRAALERMQATLDHQPRKTRSSVALPFRYEIHSQSRKFVNGANFSKKCLNQKDPLDKKFNSDPVETALCHIQITTSSSQCNDRSHQRQISNNERIITVGSISDPKRQ